MNILDHISESLEKKFGLKILKFFDADPDPGSGIFLTRYPGWKKLGSGINIPDPQHWFQFDLSAYSKMLRYGGRELNKSENAFIRLVSDESASVTISDFMHCQCL
jgi:hypothetical protein